MQAETMTASTIAIQTGSPADLPTAKEPAHLTPATPTETHGWLRRKLTPRKLRALARYLALRARYRNLRVGLFYLDRGGELEIGPEAEIAMGRSVRFMRDFTGSWLGQVQIGDGVFFNRNCYMAAYSRVVIGDYTIFGEGVSIHDENHITGTDDTPIEQRGYSSRPIVIGKNVWVGAKATILGGVNIGDNAVIGAHAVVTHDVPANCIAVGIPARVVRSL